MRAPSSGKAGEKFQCYTGSQAIVHKDRILLWPRERLAALGADGEFCSVHTGNYECAWHVL
eukprot:CAMPEP_0170328426 /NCGR_PEP_ID=MMETSP0116_2-20130129/65118_1 /TAXON_ID=400756 /ORGANISM="Durinskia baltica, Strain CSIRO CS-38" /LENGTH=60 /DNA_ID=CAMNT_0010581539 /DNA_START=18 /DNA_END=197 /DNA_ORIENTATION=-